jgi:hypothetical protein
LPEYRLQSPLDVSALLVKGDDDRNQRDVHRRHHEDRSRRAGVAYLMRPSDPSSRRGSQPDAGSRGQGGGPSTTHRVRRDLNSE